MATKIRDGFDFYGALTEAPGNYWTAISAGTLSSANTRFGAGQCLVCPTTGTAGDPIATATFSATTATVFITLAFSKTTALTGTDHLTNILLFDGGTVQFFIRFDSDGDIEFLRGPNTLLGTYSGAFAGNGAWDHFQIKIIFSQTVGEIHVRKNGNTSDDFTLTGLDTAATANLQITGVELELASNTPQQARIDDFWIFDSTAGSGDASDWVGDVRAVQIMPNADTAQKDFTPSTGTDNYALVDELTNSSADYVSSSTVGHIDEYTNPGFVAVPTSILSVVVRAIGLKSDAGARSAGVHLKSGATSSDSAGSAMGTVATSYIHNVHLDPDTSAAWTASGVAAAKFGPKVTA